MKTLALVLFATTLSAQPLEKIASRIDGVTGVTAVHLESGRRVSLNGDARFPMASTYKFPIAIVALRQVDAGVMSLDQRIVITPQQYNPGHSPLREEMGGKRAVVPLERLIRVMVSVSDNTACDLLIPLLGGPEKLTRAIATPGIRIDRTELVMSQAIRKDGAEAFGHDPRDTATPDAMADLLVRFWKNELGLSKRSHDLLLKFMTETSTGPNRLRAGVPANVRVAHKTGTWPLGANDVGILESADGKQHIAIAVYTKNGTATTEQREKVIAAVTRAVWEELTR
jgi:beta-lactamase class A